MQFLLFIPALLVFLYALYRLVKDDYIFIRKGISLEQTFDIAFIMLWISLFTSRFFYLLFHLKKGESILIDFFSLKNGGLSLTGAILGGTIAIFLVSKYKRLPLGRLSDFISLSFLFALPLLFLANALFVKKNELLLVFLNAIIYFVLMLFVVQFLYPKIMNRSFKEGMLAVLFLLLFSLISLATSLLTSLKSLQAFINPENIILSLLLITSIVLLIRQERTQSRSVRTTFRS
jgi:prolipoprotein diacylglyceryltransferase